MDNTNYIYDGGLNRISFGPGLKFIGDEIEIDPIEIRTIALGATGATGSVGEQGTQGYQGPQGEIGLQGYQGVQGFQGDMGYQGPQGSQGPIPSLDPVITLLNDIESKLEPITVIKEVFVDVPVIVYKEVPTTVIEYRNTETTIYVNIPYSAPKKAPTIKVTITDQPVGENPWLMTPEQYKVWKKKQDEDYIRDVNKQNDKVRGHKMKDSQSINWGRKPICR